MLRRLLAAVLVLHAFAGARAQAPAASPVPATGEVEVRAVRFNYPRVPGDAYPALEAEVELDVRGAPANNRFVDRVKVSLLLAVQVRGRPGADYAYYRAEWEGITLENGRRFVRFYLPPEVVRRDNLSGDPYAYAAEVSVGDRPQPLRSTAISPSVRDRARFDAFRQAVAQAASETDGILQPQHLFRGGLVDDREASTPYRRGAR